MRMLEGKKIEHRPAMKKLADVHKPTMKKLGDIKPGERRQVELWMAEEPKQLINELIVPVLAQNIYQIKALKKRVGYLEVEVVILTVALVATAICAAL